MKHKWRWWSKEEGSRREVDKYCMQLGVSIHDAEGLRSLLTLD